MSGALRTMGCAVAMLAALACNSSTSSGQHSENGGSTALAGAGGANGGAQAGGGGGAPASGGSGGAGAGGITANAGGRASSSGGGSGVNAGGAGAGGSGHGGGQSGGAATGGAGQAGGGSGGASAFHCPAGPFSAPVPAGATVQRLDGVPPADAFNNQGNTRTNIEGAVFIGGVLYVSEFPFTAAPTSRILAISVAGSPSVSVALSGVGSNGMAVDAPGNLVVTNHVKGAVERYSFPLGTTPTTLVASYDGKRFDSPNDLAVRSDGTVYFSDPDYQAPPRPLPQTATRVYRLPPGASEAVVIDDTRSEPNGVSLSPDEKTLYVAGTDGIKSYPVQPDGSVASGSGVRIQGFNGSADGLGVDCAGNLYAASGKRVAVLSPAGMEIASVSVDQAESVTNVAFGGADRKTLFITSMGTGSQRGVFRVDLAVPGFPY